MTTDRLNRLLAAAMRAERLAAYREPAQPWDAALVDAICSGSLEPIVIDLPAHPAVDEEYSAAARNGTDEGLPADLEATLRQFEESDQQADPTPEDDGDDH
jgi:hypothetical protein